MLRIDAYRSVALVKNAEAIGDRAVRQFPRHTMSKSNDALWIAPNKDLSIALVVDRGGPQPAPACLFDF
jgi:hypothetical protein